MALPFEFALDGPPASQQARRRSLVQQWMQNVRSAAQRHWDGSPPASGPVMVSIVYVFDSTPMDVDNIPKPILDALIGLVYFDDSQVIDLTCRMRRWDPDLRNATPSPVFDEFLHNHSEFVYVRASDASGLETPL